MSSSRPTRPVGTRSTNGPYATYADCHSTFRLLVGYKPSAAKSVDEYAKLDANDDSLARWKASLGLTGEAYVGDTSKPRVRRQHSCTTCYTHLSCSSLSLTSSSSQPSFRPERHSRWTSLPRRRSRNSRSPRSRSKRVPITSALCCEISLASCAYSFPLPRMYITFNVNHGIVTVRTPFA